MVKSWERRGGRRKLRAGGVRRGSAGSASGDEGFRHWFIARKCTETFWEGHVQAFAFFGGVPKRISYDHTKIAVAEIIGGGKGRRLTPGLCQLKSHYLFAHHFCRPARGHEKGGWRGR